MKPFVVFSSVLFPPLEGFLEDFFRLLNASVVAHSPSYLLFLWCLLRNDSTLQFCFGKIVVLVNDKDKGIQKRIIKSYSSFFFYFTFLPSSSFLSPTFTSYSSSPFPLLIFSSSNIFFLAFPFSPSSSSPCFPSSFSTFSSYSSSSAVQLGTPGEFSWLLYKSRKKRLR